MRCLWKKYCAVLQRIYHTKIYRKIHDHKKYPWTNSELVPCYTFSCQRVKSVIKVSPSLHGTAWRRISSGVLQCGHVNRQNSHQRSKERISFFFCKRRKNAVAQAQLEDPDLCIGGPMAFQSPSAHGEDTSKPLEIHIGDGRWYVVGYNMRSSHGPKMISNRDELPRP